MTALPSAGFGFALLFGAVGVWFHAWNQFNRPSYGQSPEFARLLSKLQPSDMRNGGVFLQSFLIYAAILTIVYLALCVFLTVPALHDIVAQIPGLGLLDGTAGAAKLPEQVLGPVAGVAFDEAGGFGTLGSVDQDTGPSASIPLAVSLAVVGLAPNVPWLSRFEEFVRATAHRLSGIPTQLVGSTLTFRSDPLIPDEIKTGLLLSASDWDRIAVYEAAAGAAGVAFKDDFVRDIRKIVALRRWVLEGAVGLRDSSVRSTYISIENEVQGRITALIRDLDAISGGTGGGDGNGPPRRDWPALVRETEETLEDLCLLVLLFSEHRAMWADAGHGSGAVADPERRTASGLLFGGLERASGQSDEDNAGSMLFFRLTGAIVLVAGLLGALLYEPAGDRASWGRFGNSLTFVASATATYVVALFFALSYQQSANRAASRADDWENALRDKSNVSRFIPQLLFLFLASVAIAMVSRIAFHLYFLASNVGFQVIRDNWSMVIDFALKIEIVFAVLGGALAVSTVLIMDAWRAGRLPALKWRFIILTPLALGLIQVLAGGATNLLGGTMSYKALAWLAAPPVAVGLVVAIYAIRSLSDEFPETYATGSQNA